MKGPPDLSYPCGAAHHEALGFWLLALLWASGLTVWALAVQTSDLPGAWWFSAVVGVAWMGWGFWRVPHRRQGTLIWANDARGRGRWVLSRQDGAARPQHLERLQVVLDMQSSLLLRATAPDGTPHWIWLHRRDAPPHWHALRRTVFSQATP